MIGDVDVSREENLLPGRTDWAAERTQLPETLVPSPIASNLPVVAETWSQDPEPMKTSLPIAMRASPDNRIGSCSTDRRPKLANEPLTRSENTLSRQRTARRYRPREPLPHAR